VPAASSTIDTTPALLVKKLPDDEWVTAVVPVC
jgi:hypothetical protein